MNVSSMRDTSWRDTCLTARRLSLVQRIVPVLAAILVALPMMAVAQDHRPGNRGPGHRPPAAYRGHGAFRGRQDIGAHAAFRGRADYRGHSEYWTHPYWVHQGYRGYSVYAGYSAYGAYPVYAAYPAYAAYSAYPVYPQYPAYALYQQYPAQSVYETPPSNEAYYAPAESTAPSRPLEHVRRAVATTATATTYDSANVPPPPIPVYEQPPIPGDGYIWTPGYWANGADGYFWVAGTWVLPPYAGALWTPGYWGLSDGYYAFHQGYWGLHVGFYGGVNYGFGYYGVGYLGGHWNGRAFVYNRGINNIGGVRVHNAYNWSFVGYLSHWGTHTSFDGGAGGIKAHPMAMESVAARDRHLPPVAEQQRQVGLASRNRAMYASFNHGAPAIAATRQAGSVRGVGAARANEARVQDRPVAERVEQARPVNARETSTSDSGHRSAMQADARAPRHADHTQQRFGPRPFTPSPREEAMEGREQARPGRAVGPNYASRYTGQPHPEQHASGPHARYDEKNAR